jgi:hypothetical protein
VLRERELDQNSVDIGIAVELLDCSNDGCRIDVPRELQLRGSDADIGTCAHFVAHVDDRSGIFTDQNDGKTGNDSETLVQALHPLPAFGANLGRDRAAIDNSGGHPVT